METTTQEGFTLVEALVALFVTTLILLSIAELMTASLYIHRSAADLTETTALAAERLEQLRKTGYAQLIPGGSVDVNSAGFFEQLDLDSDGIDDYTRRWEIRDLGDRKEIWVRTISTMAATGTAKQATLTAILAPE